MENRLNHISFGLVTLIAVMLLVVSSCNKNPVPGPSEKWIYYSSSNSGLINNEITSLTKDENNYNRYA